MPNGDVDLDALRAAVGPQTAGIMLTNPSTLGVFERQIEEVARIVHDAGGLLYYDGANLNAILGKVRPGRHGLRRHPHEPAQDLLDAARRRRSQGGAVGVGERLLPFLPVPIVGARASAIAGSTSATCRSRSAGCRRSWATPACCCGLCLHADARPRRHEAASASSRR